MPTVSVIVPAYEAAEFVDAALASAAAQSRPADEVVVLDDGSQDNTTEVVRRWRSVLPIVAVTKPANQGLGAARRDAIARSSGELVALLDADDYWLPDHLAVLLDLHARHGGIVSPLAVRWSPGESLDATPVNRNIPRPRAQPRAILERNFLLATTLFERAAYNDAGGFRPLRADEDWDLWIRMIRRGARVTIADTVTVAIRNRPDSLSAAEGCLPFDIALLTQLEHELDGRSRRIVRKALRRRCARVHLLNGYEHARAGRPWRARGQWAYAALQDRSARGGMRRGTGSVALRAVLCAMAPRLVVARRDQRLVMSRPRPTLRSASQ